MTYLVGYSADRGGQEALALGRLLAKSEGVGLTVANIVPQGWGLPSMGRVDAEYVAYVEQLAGKTLAKAKAALGGTIATQLVIEHARTPAEGLLAVAGRTQARGIVVGSTRDGSIYRYTVAGVANSLLHHAPVPVALAPKNFRGAAGGRIARVTCAHAGLDDTPEALTEAVALTQRLKVPLRLASFVVRDKQMYPTGAGYDIEHAVANQWRSQAEAAHAAVRASLPADLAVESATGDGDSWRASLTSIPWQDEVLVIGSSRRGMLARVFLGSASTAIIQHAPVPVIAVPLAAAR